MRLVCVFLGVLIVVLVAAGCASLPAAPTAARPTGTPEVSEEPVVRAAEETPTAATAPTATATDIDYPPPLDGSVPITVRWILDGDSLEADTPWGNVEVRLLGVNANEQGECFGEEAKDALIERLDKDAAELWVEVHETYGPDRDEYGRLLAYIWQNGRLINLDQIADGYALARSPFGHPLEGTFEAAASTARSDGLGLWSPTACGVGAPTNTAIVISDLQFDAPGRDDENPNGEWIELANDSAEIVDLGGWMIRDESTRHRYEFAADFLLAPGGRVRLHSGCGDDAFGRDPIELFWCGPFGPVWSNSGDTAIVQDPAGNIVVSESYESIYD